MGGFIDVHSHILPDVDDGAEDIDETMQMLNIATKEGFKYIIFTPHYRCGCGKSFSKKIQEKIDLVNTKVSKQGIDLYLYIGCEIYYSERSLKELSDKTLPTMAGSRYVLIEFHPIVDYNYIVEAVKKILLEGYYPIIAHIERYKFITDSLEKIENLIKLGAKIQINASSIISRKNPPKRKIARDLLKNKLVHYVSTDAHDSVVRSPHIRKCIKFIERRYGKDYAMELLYHNPNKIINRVYD